MTPLSFSQFASVIDAWGYVPQAFLSFHVRDLIDIVIVSVVIYFIFIFIKQTRSFFIVNSLVFLVVISILSRSLDLGLTRQLFQPLLAFFLFIFVIVFQREIRRFFKWFAEGKLFSMSEAPASHESLTVIAKSVFDMAKKKIGAIIVLPGEYPLDELLESGYVLNGAISYPLIVSIFDSATPGHDGAMLIENNRVKRFALHLPLAEDFKSRLVGTRHRAAVGITERTDALAIVVSEERGTVSVAENGALRTVMDEDDLIAILRNFIKENNPVVAHSFWHFFFVKNLFTKILSFVVACILWFAFVFQVGVVQQQFNIPVEFRFLPKELSITATNVTDVKVTLAGNNHDLAIFDPKSIKVAIDLTNATSGKNKIPLTKTSFSIPSYLTVTDFSPTEIRVDIATSSAQ